MYLQNRSRFECPDLRSYAEDQCYFKGRSHYVGEQMASDILPRCMTSCICGYGFNGAQFKCSHVQCPSMFGNVIDLSCVEQYDDLNSCCSSRLICGKCFRVEFLVCQTHSYNGVFFVILLCHFLKINGKLVG